MLNYVNNAYDKTLKACDAQQFSTLTQSSQTERLILAHRGGDTRAKAKLPALTYMGVLDKDKYKAYLAKCEAQGTKPFGSRRVEFMRPTGLLMLDFDHVNDPHAVYQRILQVLDVAGIEPAEILALVHITPSGDGLRVVMVRTKGQTIEQDQVRWAELIGIKPDATCKDISRLSFAPMQREILYFNPSLLFGELPEAGDYPDGSLWGGVYADPLRSATPCSAALVPLKEGQCFSDSCSAEDTAMKQTKEHCPSETGGRAEGSVDGTERRGYDVSVAFPTDYNGIEYGEIIKRLEEQLGGRPEHGARNSFIFTMACNLRYICNDDPAWIAAILPTYGEDPQKHRATIVSAVNRPMSRTMPETMARALRISKAAVGDSIHSPLGEKEGALPPAMPAVLPEPIALLTSRTPDRMKPAVAMAVFPSLGAYVKELRFVYADGREYEPTFMHILVAEQSAGKSAVNRPVDYILSDMKSRDTVSLNRERDWKNACARIASTQEKPERPKGLCVQILPSDMTNAAFVQRLADAEGHFLYTRMDEIELLNALRTNGPANMVSAVLRLAFDCGEYGQVRVASNAVNAMVHVRWNWNASTTVLRVRKFFAKNIADGTLSRLSFATIIEDDEDWGGEIPQYEHYDEHFADTLMTYIDRLKTCSGTLHCPEAVAWAAALNRELVAFAREVDDRGYARISRRAVLMGFFRAVLLYVMNGCKWSTVIADFAAWTVRYDLWCKMRFFRDMLHKDLEGEKTALQRGPVSLLALLPDEFTKQQVQELRIAEGMKPDPSNMLRQWVKRGQVVRDDARGVYVKQPVA